MLGGRLGFRLSASSACRRLLVDPLAPPMHLGQGGAQLVRYLTQRVVAGSAQFAGLSPELADFLIAAALECPRHGPYRVRR